MKFRETILWIGLTVGVIALGVEPQRKLCLLTGAALGGAQIPASQLTLATLPFHRHPVLVAHGKNANIAMESTWTNMVHSLENGAQVLEIDLQMTRDGHFVITHDPTFHRLAPNYVTPPHLIEALRQSDPQTYEAKKNDWDFGLVARVGNYSLEQIQRDIRLRDPQQKHDVEVITLSELLKATSTPGSFIVPSHTVTPIGGEGTKQLPARELRIEKSALLYLDLKDINQLARRLYDLPSWDWDRNRMSTERLTHLTRQTLLHLKTALDRANAFDRAFITVRHPEIARIAREVDPRLNLMFSPEGVTSTTTAKEFADRIEAFKPSPGSLVEVKYLNHILSPEFRGIAKERGWRLLYNKIIQTDPSQFEGIYKKNLPRLVNDILALGDDVIIQTNDVAEVRDILNGRR